MCIYIYIYTHMYICIYVSIIAHRHAYAHIHNDKAIHSSLENAQLCAMPYVGTIPDIPNILSIFTNADTFWASFWSPIRSICKFRPNIANCSKWCCFPRLFSVFKQWYKH